jgi:SAM-dependent methyltransferase
MVPVYQEPDIYDASIPAGRRYDQDFYCEEVRPIKDPILEVTAGTGRITIPMAQQGNDVTGLDLSAAMLAKAAEKAGKAGVNVHWVQADASCFDLNRRFGRILVPASGLCLLPDADHVRRFLQCARRHILPNGKLVMDLVPPTSPIAHLPKHLTHVSHTYSLPQGGGAVEVIQQDFDHRSDGSWFTYTSAHRHRASGAILRKDKFTFRLYEPNTLKSMLDEAGFVVEGEYGDFSKAPFLPDSWHHILICGTKG